MLRERIPRRVIAIAAAVALTASGVGAASAGAQQTQDLVVQSTTSVRDSGLLDQLITPQFERTYPEWNLRFVAVGTGQAIANARAGQGDVLIGHSPPSEAQFLADGFSHERVGRTVMWNDYVVVGPASDPAGVMGAARNDAVGALEAIAAAGASGRANFVSRGDNSGTNNKERDIWALSGVARNADDEPAASAGNPPWYHKAGLGMADTLRLTQQCPFAGGGCYTITDRGTLQQLTSNGAITALQVAMDDQAASARGGDGLMLNVYNVYAISPSKFPAVKLEGALAFMDFLTSENFQNALRSFPSRAQPGFFGAAFPSVDLARRPPRTVSARRFVTLRGTIASTVPGADPLAGMRVRVAQFLTAANPITLDRDRLSTRGRFRMRARLTRSGRLFVTSPRFENLSPLTESVGRFRVRASVSLAGARATGGRVVLRGRIFPAKGRRRARLQIRARQAGTRRLRVVRRVRLRRNGSHYRVAVNLPGGSWEVSTRYVDRGIVAPGTSRIRSLSVP